MRKNVLIFILVCITSLSGLSQSKLLTIAEKTNFSSTSTYADVMSFISLLQESSPFVKLEVINQSTEKKDIPLMIIANLALIMQPWE